MNFWRSVNGQVAVELTAADPAAAMEAVCRAGITVYSAKREEDGIETAFLISRQDLKKLEKLAQRKGYLLKRTGIKGIFWPLRRVLSRPVLIVGMALLFFLAMWLPTRVLFIQVEGNSAVPTRLILEKCTECGIGFGASRSQVRSEKVKNALLEAIPQLQWAGVNTSGCVATVTVRERAEERSAQEISGVAGIVASGDGIITRITVTKGNALCTVGQVVRAGDLLVSGYTDCGIAIRAERAEAEIYAQTQRKLTAVTPLDHTVDGEITASGKNYALIIGKKRINFYKGSGISGTTCDKIYSEYYMTLPGGFRLPVAIVTEEWSSSDQAVSELTQEDAEVLLDAFANWYLPRQMIAGKIMTGWQTFSLEDGQALLQGYYACEEMIAQVRNEEIIKPYGNDYGTNRQR